MYPSVSLSIHLSIHPSIHPSIPLSLSADSIHLGRALLPWTSESSLDTVATVEVCLEALLCWMPLANTFSSQLKERRTGSCTFTIIQERMSWANPLQLPGCFCDSCSCNKGPGPMTSSGRTATISLQQPCCVGKPMIGTSSNVKHSNNLSGIRVSLPSVCQYGSWSNSGWSRVQAVSAM